MSDVQQNYSVFRSSSKFPENSTFKISPEIQETPITNGNRIEWSPVWSVIIRMMNKMGRPRSGSPICLITSMITDRIG